MTNRDFFRLMIKLFGIYQFFIIVFSVLPSSVSYVMGDSLFSFSERIIPIGLLLLLVLAVFFLLIRFPDKIIDFFKLDKGFDSEKINLSNFNSDAILQIGLVLIGGFLIVENIASFASSLIAYFRLQNMNPDIFHALKNTEGLVFSGIIVVLGFLLITFRRQIAGKFHE